MYLNTKAHIQDGKVLDTLTVAPVEMPDMMYRYINRLNSTMMPWAHNVLDDFLLPIREGRFIMAEARPGNCKTTFSLAMADSVGKAMNLVGELHEFGPPLFVTAETTIQDMGLYLAIEKLRDQGISIEDFYRGKVRDDKLIMRASESLKNMNIRLMGQNAELRGKKMDIELVWRAVQELEAIGKRPIYVTLDYAQKLEPTNNRRSSSLNEDVAIIVSEVEEFCLQTGVPAFMPAQSNQRVDDFDVPIGNANTVHGTSNPQKLADTMMAFMKPSHVPKYQQPDEFGQKPRYIDTKWNKWPNVEDLFIVRIHKQRGMKEAVREVGMLFDVGRMEIKELPKFDVNQLDLGDLVNYSKEELDDMKNDGRWQLG